MGKQVEEPFSFPEMYNVEADIPRPPKILSHKSRSMKYRAAAVAKSSLAPSPTPLTSPRHGKVYPLPGTKSDGYQFSHTHTQKKVDNTPTTVVTVILLIIMVACVGICYVKRAKKAKNTPLPTYLHEKRAKYTLENDKDAAKSVWESIRARLRGEQSSLEVREIEVDAIKSNWLVTRAQVLEKLKDVKEKKETK